MLFCIPQRYDFSSKSQPGNIKILYNYVVLYTAKVRFFKQITTVLSVLPSSLKLFCIPQRYDFSSKSQLSFMLLSCIFWLFCIPQRYDFSSKSQPKLQLFIFLSSCFVYRKGTIFQANHNQYKYQMKYVNVVLYTAKVRFFKQITTTLRPFWVLLPVVLYTAKVRFFKQITTCDNQLGCYLQLFCIPQRYDFSSKSQHNLINQFAKSRLFCIPQRYDFSSKSQLVKVSV